MNAVPLKIARNLNNRSSIECSGVWPGQGRVNSAHCHMISYSRQRLLAANVKKFSILTLRLDSKTRVMRPGRKCT